MKNEMDKACDFQKIPDFLQTTFSWALLSGGLDDSVQVLMLIDSSGSYLINVL